MIRRVSIVIAVLVGLLVSSVGAHEFQIFPVLHGTRTVHGNVGLAVWSIFPNCTTGNQNVFLIGGRVTSTPDVNGRVVRWVEPLVGSFNIGGESVTRTGVRFNTALPYVPLSAFGEIMYVPRNGNIECLAELNHSLTIRGHYVCDIGGEIETYFTPGGRQTAYGPHLGFPISQVWVTIAYLHRPATYRAPGDAATFWRAYTAFNF